MASLRALLALALLAGLYLVASTLVLGYLLFIGVLIYYDASSGANWGQMPVLIWVVGGNAPVVAAIVHGILMVSRPPRVLPGSVLLHRDDAPDLWDTVAQLAEKIGAPVPTELRLTAEANAAVREETRLLGFSVGVRRMYIGMPLLLGLSADELRAVLCHELGHYARGHTRFGAMVYRGSAALSATHERIASAAAANQLVWLYSAILRGPLSAYRWLYDVVSLAVRRTQEFEADAAAASITGQEVTSEALRSAHMLAIAWDDFRTRFLQPMTRTGRIPDDPFSAFGDMLDDPEYRDVLTQWWIDPPEQPRSRLDSHPTLEQRLIRLAERPHDSAILDSSPARAVLIDPHALSVQVWNTVRPSQSGGQPWRDWLRDLAEYQATEPARGLPEAAQRLGGTPTLGGVLDLLETGGTSALTGALTDARSERGVPADVGRNLLVTGVCALIGQHLVQAGMATWTGTWTGAGRLVARDTTSAEIFDLVRAAVDTPTEVARLRLHVAALGIDDKPRTAPARPESPGVGSDRHVVVQPANLTEQRKIAKIALPTVGLMLFAILLAPVIIDSPEPSPQFSGLGPEFLDVPKPIIHPYLRDWHAGSANLMSGCYQPNNQSCPLPSLVSMPPLLSHFIVVEPGDTLSRIACEHQTTVDELVRLNDLSSTVLAVGQQLDVPTPPIGITARCG